MRNQIKQLLKKEGGFTLVELLGVIVILGLIIGISIPLIGNVIAKAEGDTTAAQEELVIDAAKMYELQTADIDADGITTTELIAAGFLESDFDGDLTVTKTTVDGKITYEVD
ncbi:prepilin-type N-terminal cleavage/methylation domain-containing protein [Trichococcus collinsii]|uniref:Type IV pilus assembly protein PilA n=1 Tax=Trichococcus collinsii TaxID=157076 RepID=A0AB38A0Z5_9LACT|nr:prepilin-type N-terminal cleavage/methylation domain-containing protein [Trichococcus collinsii]CZQ91769.1 bacterial general secretion pathway protein g-type pilin [Trichococcus collinsii]SEA55967.1 type IV pilus assembly protein PilA [Trichococcus collinsii]HEX5352280.1 prepilin-type N-terminal cleavage/methylation domain-containing protein [Trichococcus sp.]